MENTIKQKLSKVQGLWQSAILERMLTALDADAWAECKHYDYGCRDDVISENYFNAYKY